MNTKIKILFWVWLIFCLVISYLNKYSKFFGAIILTACVIEILSIIKSKTRKEDLYFNFIFTPLMGILFVYLESQENREFHSGISDEIIELSGYFPNRFIVIKGKHFGRVYFYFAKNDFNCYQRYIDLNICDFIPKYKNQPTTMKYDLKTNYIVEIKVNDEIVFSQKEYLNRRRMVYRRIAHYDLIFILILLYPLYLAYRIKQDE